MNQWFHIKLGHLTKKINEIDEYKTSDYGTLQCMFAVYRHIAYALKLVTSGQKYTGYRVLEEDEINWKLLYAIDAISMPSEKGSFLVNDRIDTDAIFDDNADWYIGTFVIENSDVDALALTLMSRDGLLTEEEYFAYDNALLSDLPSDIARWAKKKVQQKDIDTPASIFIDAVRKKFAICDHNETDNA